MVQPQSESTPEKAEGFRADQSSGQTRARVMLKTCALAT